jgi:hypothetical protein
MKVQLLFDYYIQIHNIEVAQSGVSKACLFICPAAKNSSIRISHIKKVQQQNLPQQKSPVAESPTSK